MASVHPAVPLIPTQPVSVFAEGEPGACVGKSSKA